MQAWNDTEQRKEKERKEKMKRENHEMMCQEIARYVAIVSHNRWQDIAINIGLDEDEAIGFDHLFEIAYKKLLKSNINRQIVEEEKEKARYIVKAWERV